MTLVNVTDLNRFGQEIQFDDAASQWFNSGRFVELFLHATVSRHTSGQLRRLLNALNELSTRWNSALTISAKIDWLHDKRGEDDQLPNLVWMEFLANDISGFLGDVRAVFDCVRNVLKVACPTIQRQSLSSLRSRLAKDPSRAATELGDDIATLIGECDWFEPLKDLRDALVHQHTKLIVAPFQERIEFTLLDGPNELISDPELLSHEGVVDFHYFAAAVLSRLYCFVEGMSECVTSRIPIESEMAVGQSVYFAYGTARHWTIELLNHIEST
jgi:hypothetical protein